MSRGRHRLLFFGFVVGLALFVTGVSSPLHAQSLSVDGGNTLFVTPELIPTDEEELSYTAFYVMTVGNDGSGGRPPCNVGVPSSEWTLFAQLRTSVGDAPSGQVEVRVFREGTPLEQLPEWTELNAQGETPVYTSNRMFECIRAEYRIAPGWYSPPPGYSVQVEFRLDS